MQNLEVMVMLFTMVILGYAACKLGYMGDKFDKKLSSIVVDITCPLLVLSSVMGDEMPDRSLILPLVGVIPHLHHFVGVWFLGSPIHIQES